MLLGVPMLRPCEPVHGAVDGLWRINVDEGGFADVGVFSSSSRTAFGHLKVGTDPVAGSGSIRNTNVQMNTDGSISVTGSGTGNPTMNTLTDAGNIRSRLVAGLTTDGDVDRAVPVAKGGTSQTNTNRSEQGGKNKKTNLIQLFAISKKKTF